ncbi:acyltransferase family-domain-containing protein [Poronia punctata]|nr:acyltransferase family-domain-containing protein [Poronia punctata]
MKTRISQIFDHLRLNRRPDAPNNYYQLLGNESGQFEKEEAEEDEEDTELSSSTDGLPHVLRRRRFNPRWVLALFPSFLHTDKGLRPTAWLDGLRGIASLFVVLHHMSLLWFPWTIHNGWANGPSSSYIQLPIIRLIISGPANVMLFFVVSGYALSYKPITILREGKFLEMYQSLASSIFRRHARLFIPAIIMCFPAPIIAFLGGFGGGGGGGMKGAAIRPMDPPRFDSIWGQMWHYGKSLITLTDVYNSNGGVGWVYSDSLWTLPVEFRSSLVVFGLLVALSKCTRRARLVVETGVAVYSWWLFHWAEFLFVGGMVVVDSTLGGKSICWQPGDGAVTSMPSGLLHGTLPVRDSGMKRPISRLGRLCAVVGFILALFVLGMPERERGAAEAWGFKGLAALVPEHFHADGAADRFWQPLAAVLLVLIIDRAEFLQGIFTTRLAQYLGRISFALYLVHMLILHSLGFWLGNVFWEITGSYGCGVGLAGVAVMCVIVCVADLGSRFVDGNVVQFTGWVYRCLCKSAV